VGALLSSSPRSREKEQNLAEERERREERRSPLVIRETASQKEFGLEGLRQEKQGQQGRLLRMRVPSGKRGGK